MSAPPVCRLTGQAPAAAEPLLPLVFGALCLEPLGEGLTPDVRMRAAIWVTEHIYQLGNAGLEKKSGEIGPTRRSMAHGQ